VDVQLYTTAAVPLKLTVLSAQVVLKFVPVMVTVSPTLPLVGVKLVIVGDDPVAALPPPPPPQPTKSEMMERTTHNRKIPEILTLHIEMLLSEKTHTSSVQLLAIGEPRACEQEVFPAHLK
jgi:hypothetical protein